MSDAAAARPVLSVVTGEPTAEELAALVIALTARAGQPGPAAPSPAPSQWAAKSRQLRPQLFPGPGAWRASALPG
jgi:Acyl-CoA carboxylase epsilon subunit